MGKKDNGKDFLVGAIVGGVIGAATALFLAPKTGQELRQGLNNQASVVKEKTNTLSKTITEQSSQIMNKVKDRTTSMKQDPASNHESEDRNESDQTDTTTSNVQLFQEKLAEAEKALLEAESGVK